MDALEKALAQSSSKREKVIISESLFSMSGKFAPLEEIYQLAQKYNAWCFIDEAHTSGIYGARGLGLVDELGEPKGRVISVHTMGKAFAGQGAFVLSSPEVREWLINTSRSFIYTTAPPPIQMVQWKAVFSLWQKCPHLRQKLFQVMSWWGKGCKSHIVPVPIAGNEEVVAGANALAKENFFVRPIRYPTVPVGKEQLRICLSVELSREQIERIKRIIDCFNN